MRPEPGDILLAMCGGAYVLRVSTETVPGVSLFREHLFIYANEAERAEAVLANPCKHAVLVLVQPFNTKPPPAATDEGLTGEAT